MILTGFSYIAGKHRGINYMKKTAALIVIIICVLCYTAGYITNVKLTKNDNDHTSVVPTAETHNDTESSNSMGITEIFVGDNPQSIADTTENAIKIYYEFLNGERVIEYEEVEDLDIYYFAFGKEDFKNTEVMYTFFDSNGDGIPDLHIKGMRDYQIFTSNGKDFTHWKTLDNYSYPLKNGTFFYKRSRQIGAWYRCFFLNFKGDEVWNISFSDEGAVWDDNTILQDFTYDFVDVPQEIWSTLTARYFEEASKVVEWSIIEVTRR